MLNIAKKNILKNHRDKLENGKIVLCKEICDDEQHLVEAHINPARIKIVLEEATRLCQHLIDNGKR